MTNRQLVAFFLFPLAGYLLGSIPWAFVIGKAHGIDIRTVGSKNIGATNLGRTLGPRFFWYAFLLDAAKGFLPVLTISLLVRHWNSGTPAVILPSWAPLLTAIAAVLGHTFPLWLKFKGGKGVATSFGVVLGVWPLYTVGGLAGGLVFVATLLIYRYISLASIVGVIGFVLTVAILGTRPGFFYTDWRNLQPLLAVAILFAFLIIFRHRANIGRLLKGTEPQIGKRERDKARLQNDPSPPDHP